MAVMGWGRFKSFWRGHPVLFRIALSLFIGLALEITVNNFPFPALKFVRQTADDTADVMTRFSVPAKTYSASAPRFAFINIDEKTWLSWGAPLVTPRDKIAMLLGRVAESKPAIIILDVDLSFHDDPNTEPALNSFLQHYPATAPPLVLVRSLEPSASSIHSKRRLTPYETSTDKQNIFWAVPSFERGDDAVVRRWQLASVACKDTAPLVIPSLQLQAVWLWLQKPHALLDTALSPLRPGNCDDPAPNGDIKIKLKGDNGPIVEINGADPSSRIIYTMPWVSDALVQGPEMPGGSFKVVVRNADTVSRIQPGDGVPGIEGSIAIIGGSFAESGDWYQTPLGDMPGTAVLINAIDALAQNGTPQEPTWGKRLPISLGFILFVSICVGLFRAPVAAFLSLLGIGGLMFATLSMFKSGLILSLAIPSLGILLADFILSFLHMIEGIMDKGWRWIFKPSPAPDRNHEEET